MDTILDNIARLANKGLHIARQISDATLEIKKCLESESMYELNGALELRQKWIDEAEATREMMEKHKQVLYKKYPVSDIRDVDAEKYPIVNRLKAIEAETADIYREISETDKLNMEMAEALLKKYKDGILSINRSREAANAYGKGPSGQPIILSTLK
ncbi:MAG TPA: hypothetical protein PK830_02965 [Candidatus Atribacteria bacterium]|nr:hypothetical protein [Candidatus Atribacteria bacterium]HPT78053.1 hypothetical protein [Candidatus Atribacteria bacterium]